MTSYIQRYGNQMVLVIAGEKYMAMPTSTDVWLLNGAEAGPGPGPGPGPGDQTFDWPFDPATTVTSEYGPRDGKVHQGIDFGKGGITEGTEIHAAAGGVIYNNPAAYHSGFGNHVVINHGVIGGRQLYTLYAHMLHPAPWSQGQDIEKWDIVGLVNNTGSSKGNHLHWETHIANPGGGLTWSNPGTHINPRTFMATYENTVVP
jgi:murein DD-endopeptidase MepM/ murein hydrolase activator NlpD